MCDNLNEKRANCGPKKVLNSSQNRAQNNATNIYTFLSSPEPATFSQNANTAHNMQDIYYFF